MPNTPKKYKKAANQAVKMAKKAGVKLKTSKTKKK